MNNLDFKAQTEIQIDIKRIQEIIDSKIFSSENIRNPLLESAFTELIIRLRDLMSKSEKSGNRIKFQDDIVKIDRVNDVTGAIAFVRNAACHIDSPNNIANQSGISIFNVFFGKGKMQIGQKEYTSDYNDDVCFFYGEQKLYLNRHLIRAFSEAKGALDNQGKGHFGMWRSERFLSFLDHIMQSRRKS